MYLSRRKFIKTSGTLALGSGLLVSQACSNNEQDTPGHLAIDYVGPDKYYDNFRELTSGISELGVLKSNFEEALNSKSPLAFIADPASSRSSKIIMLLEQGKELLVLPPMAQEFNGFNAIQQLCNQHDRRLALVNPFRYYPAVQKVKELLNKRIAGTIKSVSVEINIDWELPFIPAVESIFGPGLLLINTVIEILSSFPVSVSSLDLRPDRYDPRLEEQQITFNLTGPPLNYTLNSNPDGWTILFQCDKCQYIIRENGELVMNDSEVIIPKDKHCLFNSLEISVSDFIESVRSRREPESNTVEGLAQIILSSGVTESIRTGQTAPLFEQHQFVDSDRKITG